MGRSRLAIRGKAVPAGPVIFITFVMPWNAELLQVAGHVATPPSAVISNPLEIRKLSVTADTDFTMLLGTIDLSVGPIDDFICVDIFQFMKGDTLQISYTNADAITLGVEAIIREAE